MKNFIQNIHLYKYYFSNISPKILIISINVNGCNILLKYRYFQIGWQKKINTFFVYKRQLKIKRFRKVDNKRVYKLYKKRIKNKKCVKYISKRMLGNWKKHINNRFLWFVFKNSRQISYWKFIEAIQSIIHKTELINLSGTLKFNNRKYIFFLRAYGIFTKYITSDVINTLKEF